MVMNDTKSVLNLDGANVKMLKRIDNKLAVVKFPIQNGMQDTMAEVMIYQLAYLLGVPCCEAGMLDMERSYSVVESKNIVDFETAFKIYKLEIRNTLDILKANSFSIIAQLSFVKINLFDLLTRQLDRNSTNLAIVGKELYPLYDNGLSLFSTTSFKEELEFTSVNGDSQEKIEAIIDFSSKLNLTYTDFLRRLSHAEVYNAWKWAEGIYKINLNKLIDWVIRMQDKLISSFEKRKMSIF